MHASSENIKMRYPARIRAFTALLVFFLSASFSFAQDSRAKAELDTNVISIGEQVRLKLTFQYNAQQAPGPVIWPQVGDTITKNIDVVSKTKIDTVIPDKNDPYTIIKTQTLILTSFDSGYFAIPPFRFSMTNDTNRVVETEALLLQVNTIPIDTAQAIKDIKPPLDEPFDFRELIPYVVWALAGLAVLTIAILLLRKFLKKKPVPVTPPKPVIPPHVTALEKLEKLRGEKLWQEGKLKLYHSSLTEIVRTYIEERFRIAALEQTTDEILYSFRSTGIDQEAREKLKQLLTLADLVKFAKEQPLPHENERSISNAIDFVNATRPETQQISTEIKTELNKE